jgi:hypothetical protein
VHDGCGASRWVASRLASSAASPFRRVVSTRASDEASFVACVASIWPASLERASCRPPPSPTGCAPVCQP